jgi:hypothetical protein
LGVGAFPFAPFLSTVQKNAPTAPSHIAAHANAVKFWSSLDEKKETPLERVV